ncbi:importin-4-like [Drosophila subobscura]|uniref:importin-4-like n=1 Tax=Drosophila subobscura TaxID=7241 RepID=UPI00155AE71C|nr:importin-4-like [Drosophila subobscura]
MLSALQTFARIGAESEFSSGFDILDAMVEHAPKLLSPHIKSVVHFCLETLASKQLDDSIRAQVVSFVGCIVCVKKKLIVKHKLLQPILVVVVEMICTESDSESDEADALDNYFSGAGNTPGASATQALEQMSVHISSEKLLHTLVPIIDPAFLSGDPLYRRGGYMCLALISEGCSEAIKRNNLETMLSIIIKRGVVDKDPGVRSVAFFALGQFSEYMQPQISAFAIQILPVLLDFLHSLVLEKALDQSEGPCYMTYDRMFYALEVYCENLEDKIVPYLPVLMERLLGCMDPRNIVKIRQLALSSISAVATASKENFLPYFPTIMDALKQYLVYECSESLNPIRIQAIDTLSSISRTVGKENFMHLAQDTTQFTLTMLEQGPDDPDMRRAIYSLIGGLAIVVTENMATVLPKIMERILQTVATTEQDCRTENEQDGDVEDDDKDDSDDYELQVQNDYLFEKAEAILTLKEFAVNSYKSFSPYLTRALEAVYKNIDHGQEVIRKASVDALCAFVIALDNVLDTEGVLRACAILMPKFSKLIQTDKEPCATE